MEPLLSFLFGLAVAAAIIGAAAFVWWINEYTKRLAAEKEYELLTAKLGALDRLHSLAEKQNNALIAKLERQGAYIHHLQMILKGQQAGYPGACGGVMLGGAIMQEDEEDEENPPVSGLN